eukprot:2694000-Rhodomonas_salina.1
MDAAVDPQGVVLITPNTQFTQYSETSRKDLDKIYDPREWQHSILEVCCRPGDWCNFLFFPGEKGSRFRKDIVAYQLILNGAPNSATANNVVNSMPPT